MRRPAYANRGRECLFKDIGGRNRRNSFGINSCPALPQRRCWIHSGLVASRVPMAGSWGQGVNARQQNWWKSSFGLSVRDGFFVLERP